MISPISFSSATAQTAPDSFEERIRRPQTYIKPNTPAATDIGKDKKGLSTGKKILIGAVSLAAAVGAIVLGAKKGIFNPTEGGNKLLNGIKSGLKTVGDFICEKVSSIFSKAEVPKVKKQYQGKISSNLVNDLKAKFSK